MAADACPIETKLALDDSGKRMGMVTMFRMLFLTTTCRISTPRRQLYARAHTIPLRSEF